jgi:hypothetical protein
LPKQLGWAIGGGLGMAARFSFGKTIGLETCSLAIQFWDVYSIVQEQGKTIREVWDGVNLKFSFGRTIDNKVMAQWLEVVQIASSIEFPNEDDTMI